MAYLEEEEILTIPGRASPHGQQPEGQGEAERRERLGEETNGTEYAPVHHHTPEHDDV
jgi:hypothetical protein